MDDGGKTAAVDGESLTGDEGDEKLARSK